MTAAIPDTRACRAATELARRVSEPCLFHHVMRTHAFGHAAAAAQGLRYDAELFYLGAVLHDLGLTELAKGEQRFEVEGADLAKELLAREGMRDADIDVVWDAIALHTTVGIPPRKRPEIALVQLGAGIDVGVVSTDAVAAALPEILEAWPRLALKTQLPRYVLALHDRAPRARTSPVVADIAERHRGVRPPNLCDLIERARFAE
ncbi:MAG TPA: HD domain-containing protein [Kofleriaceae bacterium]|nr:HD domain-containing protein [Kofleriaceae bacterium]